MFQLMILLIPSLEDRIWLIVCNAVWKDAPDFLSQRRRPVIQTSGYESPLSPPTLWHA